MAIKRQINSYSGLLRKRESCQLNAIFLARWNFVSVLQEILLELVQKPKTTYSIIKKGSGNSRIFSAGFDRLYELQHLNLFIIYFLMSNFNSVRYNIGTLSHLSYPSKFFIQIHYPKLPIALSFFSFSVN